jgi:hypothetical protein
MKQIIFNSLIICLLTTVFFSCKKENEAAPETVKVYSVTEKVNNLGYADLMEIGDKWLFTAKEGENPAEDPDGKFSEAAYQPNPNVTILAPNFGGISNRTLTIPASKPVYVPILGITGWYFANDPCDPTYGPAPGQSIEAFFGQEIEAYMADMKSVTATLDGKDIVPDLTKYLVYSKAYQLEILEIFQDPNCDNSGKKANAMSGGYSLLMKIPKGKHVLNYKGVFKDEPDFEAEVTWNLTVE